MGYCKVYGKLAEELYKISNPIIKYRIDKEIYKKENMSIEQYTSLEDELIGYWLNAYDKKRIHGREDSAYENSIAKLLDLGFTSHNHKVDELYNHLLEEYHWQEEELFERIIMQIVKYPFLIRAGYWNNININAFFMYRLKIIEKTIEKYEYAFEALDTKRPKKYENDFIFKLDNKEALPTIYDLYAFAFYPKKNKDITRRIENIVRYLLDDRYQSIPQKAYIYDSIKKRYYAAGNVYHACITEERKLLTIYLLSHFRASGESNIFMDNFKQMLSCRLKDGFFELDKDLLKEKKDSYYMYSGSHMGLGEKRADKNWRRIESTFWMLKILLNLENNIS